MAYSHVQDRHSFPDPTWQAARAAAEANGIDGMPCRRGQMWSLLIDQVLTNSQIFDTSTAQFAKEQQNKII